MVVAAAMTAQAARLPDCPRLLPPVRFVLLFSVIGGVVDVADGIVVAAAVTA